MTIKHISLAYVKVFQGHILVSFDKCTDPPPPGLYQFLFCLFFLLFLVLSCDFGLYCMLWCLRTPLIILVDLNPSPKVKKKEENH